MPITNYLGWLLTTSLIYLAFAAYSHRSGEAAMTPPSNSPRSALGLYGLCALGNIFQCLKPQASQFIADNAGTYWRTSSILRASALVSFCVMGSFALFASLRTRVPATAASTD